MRTCEVCRKFLPPASVDDHPTCRCCRPSCAEDLPCVICSSWDFARRGFDEYCKSMEVKKAKEVRSSQGAPAPAVFIKGVGTGKVPLGTMGQLLLGSVLIALLYLRRFAVKKLRCLTLRNRSGGIRLGLIICIRTWTLSCLC